MHITVLILGHSSKVCSAIVLMVPRASPGSQRLEVNFRRGDRVCHTMECGNAPLSVYDMQLFSILVNRWRRQAAPWDKKE